MAILSILLTVIIVAVSILMVLVVLIQRPKQEGLGAAFGGGTLDSALGAHTTDVLQKITTWLGIIFFVSAIGLAMVKTRQFQATAANNVLEEVEDREPQLPGLPPELYNQPALDTPAPAPSPAEEAPSEPANSGKSEGVAPDAAAPVEAAAAGEKAAPESDSKGKGKAKAKLSGEKSKEGAE
jgi:preprotein translocase subunit SecG